MILHRLYLRRFLGIVDGSFEFAPGVNVIVGPNEAGKSTLRQAVKTALYENPATTSQEIKGLQTWGVEDGPEIMLEFEIDGRRFSLLKDFANRKILLTGPDRTWDSNKLVQERLVAALGLPTKQLFEATAQVAQAELERVQLTNIAKELGRIVGGAGEDVVSAIRKLDQHVKDMERGSRSMAKDPGVLRMLEEQVASLGAQCDRLTAGAAAAERKQRELEELKTPRAEAESLLTTRRALLENNRKILQRERELEGLRRQERMLGERVKKIDETLAKIAELNRQLEEATAAGLPDEPLTRTARTLVERIGYHLDGIERLSLNAAPDTPPRPDALWVWVAAAGGLLVAAGLVIAAAAVRLPGLLLAFLGVVTGAAGLWKFRGASSAQRVAAGIRQAQEAQLATMEGEMAQDRQQLSEHLARLGVDTPKAAEDRLARYQTLVRERANAEGVLSAVRAGAADEELREQWDKIRLDVFGIEQELDNPDLAGRRLTALEFQSLEGEVQRLEQDCQRMTDRQRRLEWDLERQRQEAEALADVEEQLQDAQDAFAVAMKQHGVYRAALDGLQEARRQAEVPVREVVGGRASEYLAILTSGRYRRLEVDEESLQVKVWSDDAGEWLLPEEPYLSRGTVDVVYLSARLALVTVLAEGKRPPLLLDDPFVTFDDQRRAAAATLLRELSKSHQVFLFTCGRHFDAYADRLIDLTAARTAVPESVHAAPARPQEVEVPSVGPLWESSRPS